MSTKRPGSTDTRQGEAVVTVSRRCALLTLLTLNLFSGCAALTNPTLNGIPVRRLPTEILTAPRRESRQTIPLSLLRQNAPEEYVLAPGDVLGIYVPGVLPPTGENQPLPLPPVNLASRFSAAGANLPPSVGYPVEVRKDGTALVPLIAPVTVEGMTLPEAHDAIRTAYLDAEILPAERASILVTLMQSRTTRVLVFREEVGGFQSGGTGDIAASNVKRGTAHTIDLQGYENDILHVLAQTGGLPGLDAFDSIFVFRGGMSNADLLSRVQEGAREDCDPRSWSDLNVGIVHIPTRLPSWDPIPFQPEDILLNDGDVVMIESRNADYFYTGGLLPRGEFQLPRDYDLDVVEAVAQVR
ncbi:MAG: polysaccharide biosynthesis/export family protein, partial [Planctomycetales bacterium]|nr:polysaccharide biosynthesis/export family protein [Planctomycetales bacterium]